MSGESELVVGVRKHPSQVVKTWETDLGVFSKEVMVKIMQLNGVFQSSDRDNEGYDD